MGQNILFGKSFTGWADKLGVNEDELERMIASLSRNVGTAQREGINRAGEIAAGADLPIAAQIALESGVNIGAERAISEGTTNIEQYGSEANRNAWAQVLQGAGGGAQIEAQKQMGDDAFWAELIGSAARALPFL